MTHKELSLEELAALFENDREAYYEYKKAQRDELIANSENSEQLRRLQWRIDQEVAKHTTHIGICIALQEMMLERYDELYMALHYPDLILKKQEHKKSTSQVLPFKKK